MPGACEGPCHFLAWYLLVLLAQTELQNGQNEGCSPCSYCAPRTVSRNFQAKSLMQVDDALRIIVGTEAVRTGISGFEQGDMRVEGAVNVRHRDEGRPPWPPRAELRPAIAAVPVPYACLCLRRGHYCRTHHLGVRPLPFQVYDGLNWQGVLVIASDVAWRGDVRPMLVTDDLPATEWTVGVFTASRMAPVNGNDLRPELSGGR